MLIVIFHSFFKTTIQFNSTGMYKTKKFYNSNSSYIYLKKHPKSMYRTTHSGMFEHIYFERFSLRKVYRGCVH